MHVFVLHMDAVCCYCEQDKALALSSQTAHDFCNKSEIVM